MTDQDIIARMNERRLDFLRMLGGTIVSIDRAQGRCDMSFDVGHQFCHSVDVIQGGFVTVMLDAVMSHAVFAAQRQVIGVSSLEIKTSYLEPTRAGRLHATGEIVRSGHRIAFLEGRLYNAQEQLTATASTVAKLVRGPAKDS